MEIGYTKELLEIPRKLVDQENKEEEEAEHF